MSEESKQNPRRAPAFTSETASTLGSRGGIASGRARRKKKVIREVAQAILERKVTNAEINERLRDLGIIPVKGRATVEIAILGNMANIAMMDHPASTKAGETLIRIASGEIGTPPPTLRDHENDGAGGVIMIPMTDPSLLEK